MKSLYAIATLLTLSCFPYYNSNPEYITQSFTLIFNKLDDFTWKSKKTLDSLAEAIKDITPLPEIQYHSFVEDTALFEKGYENAKKVRGVIEDKNPKIKEAKGVKWQNISVNFTWENLKEEKVRVEIKYKNPKYKDNKTKNDR